MQKQNYPTQTVEYYSALKRIEIPTHANSMDELWEHYAKWNKPVLKTNTRWFHFYESYKVVDGSFQGLRAKKIGNLVSSEFQFYEMKTFCRLENSKWTVHFKIANM